MRVCSYWMPRLTACVEQAQGDGCHAAQPPRLCVEPPSRTDWTGPDALAEYLNGRLASVLLVAGLDSPEKVRRASDEELLALSGIDRKMLALIRRKLGVAAAAESSGE